MLYLLHIVTAALALAQTITSVAAAVQHAESPAREPKRLAIIGAGAAGSSAAYHARQYADQAGIPLNITIYESNPYIGGRSTTVNAYNDSTQPVELGASIFVKINKILYDAALEFNLTSASRFSTLEVVLEEEEDTKVLGVWDGTKFVYEQKGEGGFWDVLGLLYKYGLSVIRARNLMKSTVGKFLKMYDEPTFPFADLTATVHELGLADVVGVDGQSFLRANGVSDKFANDLVQASTRVNYAQNLPFIHSLETMVCLATDDAMSIDGGNWRIFEEMIKASGAELRLRSNVLRLSTIIGSDWTIDYAQLPADPNDNVEIPVLSGGTFDGVIIAAPFQDAGIITDLDKRNVPKEIPYVTLHVTLFTSKRKLSGSAFGLEAGKRPPLVILTTLSATDTPGENGTAVGSAGFFSISTLRVTINPSTGEPEYLYKIFSPEPVNNTFLGEILGVQPRQADDQSEVSWIYRKIWQSYPQETPRTSFEKLRLEKNLWYTAGIESFISTMETSALSGKNIARLIVDGWIRSEKCASRDSDLEGRCLDFQKDDPHDWEL